MKKQKGQVIVEFALVLPLFLLLLFGIIYGGMLFYDYSVLSSLARSGAREAAISSDIANQHTTIEDYYTGIISPKNSTDKPLITSLYSPKNENEFKITPDGDWTKGIKVTITMERNPVPILVEMVLPEEYKIEYYMKKDG